MLHAFTCLWRETNRPLPVSGDGPDDPLVRPPRPPPRRHRRAPSALALVAHQDHPTVRRHARQDSLPGALHVRRALSERLGTRRVRSSRYLCRQASRRSLNCQSGPRTRGHEARAPSIVAALRRSSAARRDARDAPSKCSMRAKIAGRSRLCGSDESTSPTQDAQAVMAEWIAYRPPEPDTYPMALLDVVIVHPEKDRARVSTTGVGPSICRVSGAATTSSSRPSGPRTSDPRSSAYSISPDTSRSTSSPLGGDFGSSRQSPGAARSRGTTEHHDRPRSTVRTSGARRAARDQRLPHRTTQRRQAAAPVIPAHARFGKSAANRTLSLYG
jgi:hypothetical protein